MKENFTKELREIFKSSYERTVQYGGKSILLETILLEFLPLIESGSSEDEKFNEFCEDLIKRTSKAKWSKFKNALKSTVETLESFNKAEPGETIEKLDGSSVITDEALDKCLERCKVLNATFEIFKDNTISTSMFLFSALFTNPNAAVDHFIKVGFDKEQIISCLMWSNVSISSAPSKSETKTSTLKEKLIQAAAEESENNDEEKPKKQDKKDDFHKAGEKGSVSSKAIDPDSKTPFLDEFAYDMTQAALEGKFDPVVGRERELGSLIEILSCRKKNNAILLGEPGCGKTSVVEALVEKIAKKEVPHVLRNKRIVSLDLNALVAGAIYRGEYEKRLQGIIKEVVETKNIIVFIDEVHNLIGNGSSSGQGDGANILKPYLARGEFQIIGATTKTEYRVIEKDGALKRRFQNVVVEDPDIEETVNILNTVSERYSRYHKVVYPFDVLEVCAKWSDKYISDRHQPDKSVDLLDMSGALAKLKTPRGKEEDEKELLLENQILEATKNKIESVKEQKWDDAADWKKKEAKYRKELSSLRYEINLDYTTPVDKTGWVEVSVDDVAEVLSKITNIPVDKIKSTDSGKIKDLKTALLTNIIGQDEAIEKVIKTLQLGVLGIRDPKRPLCSFLLCGPSGTGKTYLAKLLAKYYYGNENAMVRINMGEMDEHSKARLLGSQPGTIGYDEPTPFDELATRPASVVLLDEVEKADAKIFDVILNAIGEEGYITLNNGKDISFRQSIVILTSNIGTKELAAKGSGLGFTKTIGDEKKKADSDIVMKAIKKFFRPEFLNRLTGISVFNELKTEDMKKIFDLELGKMNERTKENGHVIEVTEAIKNKIIDETDTTYGARDLNRKIMELISNEVCEELINAGDKAKRRIIVDIDKKTEKIKIKFKD